MLSILGGTYGEVCLWPRARMRFGSGLRAVQALFGVVQEMSGEPVRFQTFYHQSGLDNLRHVLNQLGVEHVLHERAQPIEFQYEHPLATPRLNPDPRDLVPSRPVDCGELDNVLIYPCVEGDMTFRANRVVYDPQQGHRSCGFRATGSTCKQLAIVANLTEGRAIARLAGTIDASNLDADAVANVILETENADAVVIKNGILGAHVVWRGHGRSRTPFFKTDSVFPIGSGDVFSAYFAYFWGEWGESPEKSANFASAAAAAYCSTKSIQIPTDLDAVTRELAVTNINATTAGGEPVAKKKVYIAGPLFNLAEIWLVSEARAALESFGLGTFSPFHDAGLLTETSSPEQVKAIVDRDLRELDDECGVVFAILDGIDSGTWIEVGRALKLGTPVVGYTEKCTARDLTMLGEGATICRDFSTALYTTAWKAMNL